MFYLLNLQKEDMENRITTILFDKGIKREETGAFRGALLTLLPDDPILHNHGDERTLYRYPKVQYKTCNGKACIIGMNEGADILERALHLGDELTLRLGRRICCFTIIEKTTTYFNPGNSRAEGYDYKIIDWLPLNQENHIAYAQMKSMHEKIDLLDRILIASILRLLQGFNHFIDYRCEAFITNIISSKVIKYKGVEMLALDITIHTNIRLPENFGLGKGSSRGHGIITEI